MTRYIIRRLIQSVFLLLGITILSFTLQHLAPGGAESFHDDPNLSKESVERQRRDFGLDQPIPVQYGKWLWQALHGNFGQSFLDKRPVMQKIAERAPNTLLLNATSLTIGLLGIPMGVFAAMRRGGLYDNFLRVFTVLGNAVPHWWLGLIILLITAPRLPWLFPIAGMYTPGNGSLSDRLHHLLLPAMLGAITGWLGLSRFMRSEFLEVIGLDYVRTARAKGLKERVVMFGHALRNALIPIVTILGGSLAGLLSGGVLIESTFSWPGMGRMAFEAATQRDFPVLMGLVVISSTLIILGNLCADIAYGFIDPRVKYD